MHLVAVTTGRRSAVVANRQGQEVEHEIRVRDLVVAADEAARLKMIGGGRPTPEEEPLKANPRFVVPLQGPILLPG